MRCNLTQKEVAKLTGLGLTTIHKFENGTAGNLSLATFLLLLKVVGQIDAINDVLPELPPSPYLMRRDEKRAQRIRHTKITGYGKYVKSNTLGRGNRSLGMGRTP